MKAKVLLISIFIYFIASPFKTNAQSLIPQDSIAMSDFDNATGKTGIVYAGMTTSAGRVIYLDLHNKHLTGKIPPSIGNLTELVRLDLSNNQLSDSLPSSFGNIGDSITTYVLLTINLSNNNLSGKIPASFGNLTKVKSVDLSYNQFSGMLPSSLGSMTDLVQLILNDNQFTDSIPSSILQLPNLTQLALDSNHLTGKIPSIPKSPLQDLSLSHNRLRGTIPDYIGNLHTGDLSFNQLSDTIPSNVLNSTTLASLSISNNHLTGNIPVVNIKNNFTFKNLDLSNNLLKGSITPTLLNLEDLQFRLNYNQFTFDGIEGITQTKANDYLSYAVVYTPQANLPLIKNGDSISVSAGGNPVNDTFRLFRNDTLLTTQVGDSVFSLTRPGKYNITVTHSDADKIYNQSTLQGGINSILLLNSDVISYNLLPLELLSFTGTIQHGDALLQWQTSSETNMDNFVVQRIIGGMQFQDIGHVNAAGNSHILKQYNYIDNDINKINSDIVHYRLKMIDKDGAFIFSNILTLKINTLDSKFNIYPNPSKNIAAVSFNSTAAGKYTIDIMDLSGKIVTHIEGTATTGFNIVNANLKMLAQGTYILNLKTLDSIRSLKFIKN